MPKENSVSSITTRNPKPNYLRVRIALHRKRHSKEIALSYTDVFRVTHRTPFLRSRKDAEAVLRGHFCRVTGISRVSFIVNEEQLEL